jgi:hypothetical protein
MDHDIAGARTFICVALVAVIILALIFRKGRGDKGDDWR